MPRTALTVTELDQNAGLNPVTYDSGDAVNDHSMDNDGNTMVLFHNDTGGAINVTIVSVADEAGRTGDITMSVGANTEAVVPKLPRRWWNQPGTNDVHIDVDGAIKIAALKLP